MLLTLIYWTSHADESSVYVCRRECRLYITPTRHLPRSSGIINMGDNTITPVTLPITPCISHLKHLLLINPDRICPAVASLIEITFLMLEVHSFLELLCKSKHFVHTSTNLFGRPLVPICTYTSSDLDKTFDRRWFYLARISYSQ